MSLTYGQTEKLSFISYNLVRAEVDWQQAVRKRRNTERECLRSSRALVRQL